MAIKWNKINWEKIDSILLDTAESLEDDPMTRFWLTMSKNSKMPLDSDGNLPKEFTWENGYKAHLPAEAGFYLCFFGNPTDEMDDNSIELCYYDDEQEYFPTFWDSDDQPCRPDYWAKITPPTK